MKTIFASRVILIVGMLMILLSPACGTVGILIDGRGGPPAPEPKPRSYPSYQSLHIPPGHLPPPGKCRIWYPGKPPGHQPPPLSCDEAFRKASMDAWVISRTGGDPKILEVREKKKSGVSVEVVINFYKID